MNGTGVRTASPWPLFLAVAGSVLVADQLTKLWAVAALEDGPVAVVGSLQFNLVRNEASAFSLGGGEWWGPLVSGVALVVVGILVWMARSATSRLLIVGLGLVVGGAVGNLIDRAARSRRGFMGGGVVDFVDLGWWPVFNIADAAITVGVIIVVGVTLLRGGRSSPAATG